MPRPLLTRKTFSCAITVAVGLCILIHLSPILRQYDPVDAVSTLIIQLEKKKHQGAFLPRAYSGEEGVVFLKTHKTGSSTVSSIIWHNLCEAAVGARSNCFLPPRSHPGKTWDLRKKKDLDAMRSEGGSSQHNGTWPYAVWVTHAVYSNALFQAVPSARRMISIVRRPSHRFQSAWHWYNHSSTLGMKLKQFARELRSQHFVPQLKYRSGLDATTDELTGMIDMRSKVWVQQAAFEDLVDRVISRRLFLLVAERFDESLLVLGALMKWSLDRLVYVKHKVSAYPQAPAEVMAVLESAQPFDSALWTLANYILDRHILDLFPDTHHLEKQITFLRNASAQLTMSCRQPPTPDNKCVCLRSRNLNLVNAETWKRKSTEDFVC